MYYRVALYQSAIQVHPPSGWQWKSTVLSSLSALLQFLRLCRALPQDHCGCSPPPHGRAWRSSWCRRTRDWDPLRSRQPTFSTRD